MFIAGCLFDGRDHTDCCVASGVPSICGDICAGNATEIDFRHFRCVQHMPEITNCALADFGVLPSQPRNFRFSNVMLSINSLRLIKEIQFIRWAPTSVSCTGTPP